MSLKSNKSNWVFQSGLHGELKTHVGFPFVHSYLKIFGVKFLRQWNCEPKWNMLFWVKRQKNVMQNVGASFAQIRPNVRCNLVYRYILIQYMHNAYLQIYVHDLYKCLYDVAARAVAMLSAGFKRTVPKLRNWSRDGVQHTTLRYSKSRLTQNVYIYTNS